MSNYFNTLPLRVQLEELGKCRFMEPEEFSNGVEAIKDKKIVIVGCGAQGLNQGLNLRDSGLMSPTRFARQRLLSSALLTFAQPRTVLRLAPTKTSSLRQIWF